MCLTFRRRLKAYRSSVCPHGYHRRRLRLLTRERLSCQPRSSYASLFHHRSRPKNRKNVKLSDPLSPPLASSHTDYLPVENGPVHCPFTRQKLLAANLPVNRGRFNLRHYPP
ncbi:hypothetical protein KCP78_10425 [Salmonella enterica subsp. enterica]|nr:hypothetical protein KCP78_10425 [Salmonella enterica subsp. enterica]